MCTGQVCTKYDTEKIHQLFSVDTLRLRVSNVRPCALPHLKLSLSLRGMQENVSIPG